MEYLYCQHTTIKGFIRVEHCIHAKPRLSTAAARSSIDLGHSPTGGDRTYYITFGDEPARLAVGH
ncbi:MAG: hypothetical protein ACXVDA_08560, partial [Ktedonobacterales bacterium]